VARDHPTSVKPGRVIRANPRRKLGGTPPPPHRTPVLGSKVKEALMLAAVEKDLLMQLSVDDLVSKFAVCYDRRLDHG
jgi:hypothetical protein